ncbi:hypothetical protein HDU92_008125 [Lobulomyces angularis]|nr:hypothetical protein HDU92_008125 [Lobulomyces angularis]
MGNTTINDFIVNSELGRGAFGIVYSAIRKSDGRKVAIKKIDKEKMRRNNVLNRVLSEIKIHSSLSHPSIIRLLAVFTNEQYIFMVMEIGTIDLYRYIDENGPITEKQLRPLLKDLIDGLLYLHSKNIIHRDLKLSNLLLTKNHLKIADFGLAVKLSQQEQKTLCGTPNYISPEIVKRQPYGLASDAWSLGCMIVTLLTGSPPFECDEVKNTLQNVANHHYICPASFSREITDLINALLQKDPVKRPKMSWLLQHQFFDTSLLNSELVANGLPRVDSAVGSLARSSQSCHLNKKVVEIKDFKRTANNLTNNENMKFYNNASLKGAHHTTSKVSNESRNVHEYAGCNILENLRNALKNSLQPFSTKRLKPISQNTKYGLAKILDTGEVLLDFFQEKYIIKISNDSEKFHLFDRPSNSNGLKTFPLRTFDRRNIPEQFFKKYIFAYRFVELIASKTAKLVFYSPQAKCILMENSPPSCQVIFYNGCKVIMCTRNSSIEISTAPLDNEKDGAKFTMNLSEKNADIPSFLIPLFKHSQDCLTQCLEIENIASKDPNTLYPLILKSHNTINQSATMDLGSKPMSVFQRSLSTMATQKGNNPILKETINTCSSRTRVASVLNAPTNSLHQQPVFLNDVGWCIKLSSDEEDLYCMLFLDGVNVTLECKQQTLLYRNSKGDQRFSIDKSLPSFAKEKLGFFPKFLGLLEK